MRKSIINTVKAVLVSTFVIAAMVAVMSFISYSDTHYNRDAEIVKVSGSTVTAMDNCGYTWRFEADNLAVNDIVVLKMFNNHTDNNIYDDEVVDVKLLTIIK